MLGGIGCPLILPNLHTMRLIAVSRRLFGRIRGAVYVRMIHRQCAQSCRQLYRPLPGFAEPPHLAWRSWRIAIPATLGRSQASGLICCVRSCQDSRSRRIAGFELAIPSPWGDRKRAAGVVARALTGVTLERVVSNSDRARIHLWSRRTVIDRLRPCRLIARASRWREALAARRPLVAIVALVCLPDQSRGKDINRPN